MRFILDLDVKCDEPIYMQDYNQTSQYILNMK